ncbi:MAG: prefoldin subunit alpha [Candidatus Woesearchaeota archaeon]|nr:prefoldin subunit alpha [Candidatus Woesearchaeota archaeon]
MPEEKKIDKEALYSELKELDEEIKKLNSHLESVDEQLSDLNSSKTVINKFTELKKGDELRIPIASGIYIKGELQDTKRLMVNVGTGVAVEKSPEDVVKILDSQLIELSGYRETIVDQMKHIIVRIEEIQKVFE